MNACEHCTRARAGIWGGFVMTCPNCRAREVARCMAAFHALDKIGSGDKQGLVDAIEQAMPDVPYREARQMVWSWWCSDHGISEAAAA